MKTVLVTGANAGIGYETCRQLAALHNVEHVILGCRSENKANEAIEQLVKDTDKPKSTFSVLIIDVSDTDSCRKAVENIEFPLDGIVMNAGGMVFPIAQKTMKDGALGIFAANVIGHAAFLDEAIAKHKLSPNCRIVGSSSEGARGIPKMQMKPPVFNSTEVDEVNSVITGKRFDKFVQDDMYSYSKCVLTLYLKAMAHKHPNLYFFAVSPGMTTGTNVYENAPWYQKLLVKLVHTVLSSHSHGPDKAAERYLVGLFGDKNKYPSGSFFGSEQNTVAGPITNQEDMLPEVYKGNTDLEESVYTAVQKFVHFE